MSETTSGNTQKIWLISAIAGIIAFLALIYVADYTTVASLIVGVLVAFLVAILLWIGWYEDPEAQTQSDIATAPKAAAEINIEASENAAPSVTDTPSATPSAALDMSAAVTTSTPVADAEPAVQPATTVKSVEATPVKKPVQAQPAKKTAAPKAKAASSSSATAKKATTVKKTPASAKKTSDAPAAKKATAKPKASAQKAESAAASKKPAKAPATKKAPVAKDGKPPVLTAARDGGADDLKLLKGVGPKLEQTLNELGFYHFDQVAGWRKKEIEWVDSNLKFKGRIERDGWVAQAKTLAKGGETEFSKRSKKSAS